MPTERAVTCTNQNVVYGPRLLALEPPPVVIRVSDSGDRFWVDQIVVLHTNNFVQLGKMYCTTPGF